MPGCNGDEGSVVVAADFCDLLAFLPLFVSKHLAQEISCIGTGGDSIILFFCCYCWLHFVLYPSLF